LRYYQRMTNKRPVFNLQTLVLGGSILVIGVMLLAGIASFGSQRPTATAQPTPTPSLAAATIIDVPIGDVIAAEIRLTYGSAETLTATISSPGATYIQPYFASIDLAPGDTVTVSAADGSQATVYTAEDAGKWAFPVDSDTAVIKINAANPAAEGFAGVEISQYGQGRTEQEVAQSVCGANDLTDVVCSASSFPTEYGLRQPVARLVYTSGGSQYVCTAWRVTSGNFMITNEHCIPNQAVLNTAVVRFNYQRASCGGGANENYLEVRSGTLLMTNATYDVALFTLHPDDLAHVRPYGYLELDTRAPVANETILIPQHPAGQPKKFGINSAQDGGRCTINAASLTGYAPDSDFGYTCDTQGGSSGSPIIALSSLKVIGLHHLGSGRPDGATCGPPQYYNQGVKIAHIAPLLAPYLSAATITPTATPTLTATFTASYTPTITPTPTASHTPTATPPRISTELLQDGGFEERSSAWVVTDTSGNDKFLARKTRSGSGAFRFAGGDGENSKLIQQISLDGITFAAGDQIELIAHIDTKGTVAGAMKLTVVYADGRRAARKAKFALADHYEPRGVSITLDSGDVARIVVQFRHRSPTGGRVFIDDATVLWSR
jgi:V8-like Glu-specific endopeptidase